MKTIAKRRLNKTHQGDARNIPWLPDNTIDCVVTSTAYFAKRRYGNDPGEMGQGTLDEFIKECVELGTEMYRVMKPDALFWWNIGDTWSGSGGAGGDHNKGSSKGPGTGMDGIVKYKGSGTRTGIARMQACLVPWRLAVALQEAGLFLVRSPIIWDKGQIKPEDPNHVRRPRFQYETILMLAKSTNHRYFHEREAGFLPQAESGDVWHFPIYRGPRIGPAVFPAELPRRCILLSTEPGDIVLDPCMGSGQTGKVAKVLGRDWVGVDLYAGT